MKTSNFLHRESLKFHFYFRATNPYLRKMLFGFYILAFVVLCLFLINVNLYEIHPAMNGYSNNHLISSLLVFCFFLAALWIDSRMLLIDRHNRTLKKNK